MPGNLPLAVLSRRWLIMFRVPVASEPAFSPRYIGPDLRVAGSISTTSVEGEIRNRTEVGWLQLIHIAV